MLKAAGLCILLFAFLTIGKELVKTRRKALLMVEELYRFVLHIKLQVSCFLRPPCEVHVGFESDELERVGFLPQLRSGAGLLEAYLQSSAHTEILAEGDRIITSLFSGIGSGYMQDEVKLIDSHAEQLCRLIESERQENPKRIRLIKTLCATASLGVIIFLI